jgi:hypothetical protein
MKYIRRFTLLMLMALLLALSLAAPHPVAAQADGTELVPGHYRGWVFLNADLTTHQSATIGGATIDFNVREKWKTEGTVDVAVTGKDQATATVKLEKFTVSITDNNFFGGNGQTCSWYSVLLARAMWAAQGSGYEKDDEDFAIPLQYLGIYSYDHVEGSVGGSLKGCDARAKPRAIDAMKLAMEETSSNLIKEVDLMVYEVGTDGSLSGSCLIPGFDVEMAIPHGLTLRTSGCKWAVFPVHEEKKGWW